MGADYIKLLGFRREDVGIYYAVTKTKDYESIIDVREATNIGRCPEHRHGGGGGGVDSLDQPLLFGLVKKRWYWKNGFKRSHI